MMKRHTFFLATFLSLAACAPLQQQENSVTSLYNCGDTPVSAKQEANGFVSLNIDGKIITVSPVETSSGAKYRNAAPPPRVTFWSKGGDADLVVDDKHYPTCQIVRSSLYIDTSNYRAIGNNPSWFATVANNELRLTTGNAAKTLVSPLPAPTATLYGQYYSIKTPEHVMSMTIKNTTCQDSLSGQYYPNDVSIIFDGEVFVGCGTNMGATAAAPPAAPQQPQLSSETPKPARAVKPADIAGQTWMIKQIDGIEVDPASRAMLAFETDGKLVGHTGCNAFSGAYKIDGKNLKIDPRIVATQIGCDDEAMKQEASLMKIIPAAALIEKRESSLILSTGHRQTIILESTK